jgi:predicted nucleic acid-binding protein
MSSLLDSSILVAAVTPDESRHAECLTLLKEGGHLIYTHAMLETFSTLTGGKLGVQVHADLAVRLVRETILPRVTVVELTKDEVLQAVGAARKHGVRGAGVYDYMHMVAARKAGASAVHTLNIGHFLHLRREGDPEILAP